MRLAARLKPCPFKTCGWYWLHSLGAWRPLHWRCFSGPEGPIVH